jgi:hypothetical protein
MITNPYSSQCVNEQEFQNVKVMAIILYFFKQIRVRINALPSRVRCARGRREVKELQCRAGCEIEETTVHIIQSCGRTHDGVIKRHNTVDKLVQKSLEEKGWEVMAEPRILGNGLVQKSWHTVMVR